MILRRRNRVARTLVALAIAAYAGVGVLGHGLHSLIPCIGGACGDVLAPACCSCGHDHCHTTAKLAFDSDAAQMSRPGHDAENCSLCALLAKINVGYATIAAASVSSGLVRTLPSAAELRLPADLVLASSARGPPVV